MAEARFATYTQLYVDSDLRESPSIAPLNQFEWVAAQAAGDTSALEVRCITLFFIAYGQRVVRRQRPCSRDQRMDGSSVPASQSAASSGLIRA